MVNLIAQARSAADHHHWATVVSFLSDLINQPSSPLDSDQEDEVLDLAIQVLQFGDFQERWDAAKVFPALGQKAIAPLIKLLQDEDAELEGRWFAARLLGELNHPTAIRALVEQVQNAEDEDLGKVAAEALAHLGLPAIKALADLLKQEDSRGFAIQALVQIHHPDTIPLLLTVVEDPTPTIRASAIDALTSFRDSRILPVLLKATKDSATVVRQAAIAGLGMRIHHQTNSSNTLDVLCDALWDVNLSVSRQAVLSLGRLQQDAAIPHLKRALTSPNTPVSLQVDIVRALSWINTESALDALEELLTHNPPYPTVVCQEAISVLGLWSDSTRKPRVAQILVEFLEQSTPPKSANIRQAIATALGQLKQATSLDALIQLLADSDPGVQFHAIAALKAIEPGSALARLQEINQQDLSESLKAGVNLALREWQIELPR